MGLFNKNSDGFLEAMVLVVGFMVLSSTAKSCLFYIDLGDCRRIQLEATKAGRADMPTCEVAK